MIMKNWQKLGSLLLTLVLGAALFTGCGNTQTQKARQHKVQIKRT